MEITFEKDYGYVIIAYLFSFVVNIVLLVFVIRGRKKYDVKYPQLYADADHKNAYDFNCC